MIIFVIYLLCFYFSIPGFLYKAGYSLLKGLIPFYNVYLLLTVLEISPIILIILSLGLIFLPERMFIVTLMYIFIPFIICDAYDRSKIMGVFALVLPFIFLPVIAYGPGTYVYDVEEG